MVKTSKKYEELRGFRTLYPEDFLRYKFLEKRLTGISERWGYFPIEPPALEYGEALTAKGGLSPEQAHELFIFKDHDERWVGLRFDLTTPIARLVGFNYESLVTKMPLRWCYFSKMWRYENDPKKGRYREFWQFGVELIGSSSPMADAEVIAMALDQLIDLGFSRENVRLFISHRELLWGLISNYTDDEDKILEIIRLIDKRDKLSKKEILMKLNEMIENENLVNFIDELLNLEPSSFEAIYELYLKKLEGMNDTVRNAVENMKQLFRYLEIMLDENKKGMLLVDPSIARGFDYYTGIIFEVYIYSENKRQGGSILGGGRYDNLIDLYGGLHTPSVGFALGVDRCIEAMRELHINSELDNIHARQDVHIIVDISNENMVKHAIEILNMLRQSNINSTITLNRYTSWRKMLKNELEYADANSVSHVLIVDDNVNEGKILLRDMAKRSQEPVEINSLPEKIKH